MNPGCFKTIRHFIHNLAPRSPKNPHLHHKNRHPCEIPHITPYYKQSQRRNGTSLSRWTIQTFLYIHHLRLTFPVLPRCTWNMFAETWDRGNLSNRGKGGSNTSRATQRAKRDGSQQPTIRFAVSLRRSSDRDAAASSANPRAKVDYDCSARASFAPFIIAARAYTRGCINSVAFRAALDEFEYRTLTSELLRPPYPAPRFFWTPPRERMLALVGACSTPARHPPPLFIFSHFNIPLSFDRCLSARLSLADKQSAASKQVTGRETKNPASTHRYFGINEARPDFNNTSIFPASRVRDLFRSPVSRDWRARFCGTFLVLFCGN